MLLISITKNYFHFTLLKIFKSFLNQQISFETLFSSQQSFRSEYAGRLLAFFGKIHQSEKKNVLKEADVIEKLKSE